MDTFEFEEQNPVPQEFPVDAEPVCQEVPVQAEPIFEEPPAQDPVSRIPEPPVQIPEPTPYRGTGSGRKESPYANSPYELRQPRSGYTPGYTFQPQTQPKPKVKKEKKAGTPGIGRRILAAVLILALIAAGCGITAGIVNNRWELQAQQQDAAMQNMQAQLDALQKQLDSAEDAPAAGPVDTADSTGGLAPAQVYARNVDSVVAISCIISSSTYGGMEGSSSGSGFILTADGYVITNHHVVEGASKVYVVTNEGEEYTAQIVGSDSTNDIAVLKVEASDLPAAVIGSSNDLIIGDMVVAIGNPLGELTSTMTVGYVSGKNREVATDSTIIDMIQTDAAINSGNSGGPLFNMKGEVVGITTAKYSGTTSSGASIEGIGFAIPIDDVLSIISDLIDYGYVTGPYLGVTVQNMDPSAYSLYGLPLGARVIDVVAGASADRAGIQVKDIIIAVGEYKVESITDLTRNLRNFKAGDITTITVVRSGAELELTIQFDERPEGFDGTVPADEIPQVP